jgi:hypothetical protein
MGRGGERVGVAISGASARLSMSTCEEHLLASTDTCFMPMFAT